MITLHVFGPGMGLPDPSPFCLKSMTLLKMSGLPFTTDTKGFAKAPKGKQPYMVDDGKVIADSTFIRWHLEQAHGIEFDKGLTLAQNAFGWAIEKMLEDHAYWGGVDLRWLVDDNFKRGPSRFFDAVPSPLRPLVYAMVRRRVRARIKGHGMGLHTRTEIETLCIRDMEAVSDILGDKPFLFGGTPCGSDATAFAFVAGILCPVMTSPIRDAAEKRVNLMAYRERGLKLWFPEFKSKA